MVHPRMHCASPQFERLLESCLHTSDRLTNAVSVGSISKKKMTETQEHKDLKSFLKKYFESIKCKNVELEKRVQNGEEKLRPDIS